MGGITPYLALTSYDSKADLQPLEGWESTVSGRACGIFLLASTFGALLYALGIFAPNTLNGGSDFTFDVIFSFQLDRVRPRNPCPRFNETLALGSHLGVPQYDFASDSCPCSAKAAAKYLCSTLLYLTCHCACPQLVKQFSQYPLVNIPTVDFFALWLLSSKPLYEDMKRRGWLNDGSDTALFFTFMAAPLLGATTWLAVRPPIPPKKKAGGGGMSPL